MSQSYVFEGPDGRLYELPADVMAKHAVPPEKVAALRQRLAVGAAASGGGDHGDGGSTGAPAGHYRPGEQPAHIPPPPASVAAPTVGAAAAPATSSTTISTPNGGTVVLNFYFGPPGPQANGHAAVGAVEGYHMTFDAHGIPVNHTEMLWGDYLDKQGNPAVGWHSHDPVSGNAQ
ncbi:MAG: hypothetical protein H6708_10470 [Kofleriaceae bacterium]|nr:hypothetical protein [Myxococcales bacterium]MCB9560819.1 hypothetical protein [Kofleriaceae bacterium]